MAKRKQTQFKFTNWGGKRRRAGRKPSGSRARVEHASRPRLSPRTPVHVTLRFVAKLPSLRTQANHRVVLHALVASSKRGFRVVHYSAMTNHVHLVCEAADEDALARGIQGLCVRLARRLHRHWGRHGTVFDDRYHVHHLNTPREVRTALAYVLRNAHHHDIPLSSEFDPCSTARWFDGWKRAVPRAAVDVRPFPTPRTWLLRVGWRRGGLLDSRAPA